MTTLMTLMVLKIKLIMVMPIEMTMSIMILYFLCNLVNSIKISKVHLHQELLIFFWKFCEHNRKFLFYVLKV